MENLTRQLEGTNGIQMGEQNIPLYTNTEKFPGRLKYLPEFILLSNKKVLKLKKTKNVILTTGELTHFSLRVLCEPFETEEELVDEMDLPSLETLQERLKLMLPFSCY